MDWQDFQKQLVTDGAYDTAPDPDRSAADRLLGGFDAWFYARMIAISLRARRLALRGRYGLEDWSASSFETLRLVERCGGRVHVAGGRNLGAVRGPAVYASNHMSLLETFLLPCLLLTRGPMAVVVKRDLMVHPLMGPVLRAVGAIAVTRDNPRHDLEEVLTQGHAALGSGRSVRVFPQATRSAGFRPDLFNSLGAKLARKAAVPLLPIALRTDFMGLGRILRDMGPLDRARDVRFRFGEPLRVAGPGRAEHLRMVRFLSETLSAWGVRADAEGGGR